MAFAESPELIRIHREDAHRTMHNLELLYSDLNSIRALPKADRHAHLLLSAPLAAYRALSKQGIPDLPAVSYGSLQNFLATINSHYLPVLSTLENVKTIVRAALEQLIADGVVYAEVSLPLTAPARIGVSWREYGGIIKEEITRVAGALDLNLELGHAREAPVNWLSLAHEALALEIFSGVDLYGNEAAGDVREFLPFFALARERGLYAKLHCGEATHATRMRYDVETIKPDAIQHGIAAAKDPELIALLRDRQVPLNVCPTSNVMTGAVQSFSEHPIAVLVAAGLNVTIASDDFGPFGSSASDEYSALFKAGILTAEELERIRVAGLQR